MLEHRNFMAVPWSAKGERQTLSPSQAQRIHSSDAHHGGDAAPRLHAGSSVRHARCHVFWEPQESCWNERPCKPTLRRRDHWRDGAMMSISTQVSFEWAKQQTQGPEASTHVRNPRVFSRDRDHLGVAGEPDPQLWTAIVSHC